MTGLVSNEILAGDEALDRLATRRTASMFAPDVEARAEELSQAIAGRRVLVVGGAGSIGAATTRLVINHRPASVHVLDQSEAYLTELVRFLRGRSGGIPAGVDLRAFPIDYGGRTAERLLREQPPYEIVLNFAAMKHVRSEKDAISTLEMLDVNIVRHQAFLERLYKGGHGARYFAVSTDKAANPTSVMGASKRLMEDLVFSRPMRDGAVTTSARFANVAFSNGSLLQGFLHRLAARQPVAVPRDTCRYFVARAEAGEICLLAAFCAPSGHVVFPRLDPERELQTLEHIAKRFLRYVGFEPEPFVDEAAAREAVDACAARRRWPLLLTPLDTSGEKPYEEFVGRGEHVAEVGFRSLLALPHVPAPAARACVFDALARLCGDPAAPASKADIVRLLARGVDAFAHVETGANLDQRL